MHAAWMALALSLSTPVEGVTPQRVAPGKDCQVAQRTARFAPHFDKVPLEEVVQLISDVTCKTFILPENLKGRISIVGPEKTGSNDLTPEQLYDVFLSSLDANGFALYGTGGYLRVVEKSKAKQGNIPTLYDPDDRFTLSEQMVTRIVRLKHLELEPTRAMLAGLVSTSDVTAVPPDLLVVHELGSNQARLEKLLAELDVERAPTDSLAVLNVRHAAATEISEKLTRVLAPKQSGKGPVEALTLVADERTNKLIAVGPGPLIERAKDLLEELDQPLEGDGQVNVYRLQNGDAKEIASNLEALAQSGKARPPGAAGGAGVFNGEIKVTANESENALLVVANPADYRSLSKVIAELDRPKRQVFIEVVIMEVSTQRDQKVGVSLHAAPSADGLPVVLGSQPEGALSSADYSSLAAANGLLIGVQGPVMTALSTLTGLKLASFGVLLQALQSSSEANVLSTPYLLVTDNQQAEINVGQKVPFNLGLSQETLSRLAATGNSQLVSAATLTQNVQREKVELKLTVKPHISEGENIRLELNQQAEQLAGENVNGPITSTRGEKTTIVARDGEAVVLGGILQDTTLESVSKTPILGDIPLLGRLFRRSSETRVKTNLLLFLTPYIIRGSEDFRHILKRKLDERREFAERFYGEVPGSTPLIDFGRKPGPLALMAKALKREELRPENGGSGNPGERVISPEQVRR